MKLVPSTISEVQGSSSLGSGYLRAKGQSLALLVETLTDASERLVVDRTNLTGIYDYKLDWNPEPERLQDDPRPSIFVAVKEQLGLQLTPAKTPTDILTVTHIERPTSNSLVFLTRDGGGAEVLHGLREQVQVRNVGNPALPE